MRTKECKKAYNFIWKIKNYIRRCSSIVEGGSFVSHVFEVEGLEGNGWCLHFYPHGISNKRHVIYSIENYNRDIGVETSIVNCTIDVLDTNNQTLDSHSIFNEIYECGDEKIFAPLIGISELREIMKEWEEDTLTLRCHIRNGEAENHYVAKSKLATEQCEFLWNVGSWSESRTVSLFGISAFKIMLTTNGNDVLIFITRIHDSFKNLDCTIRLRNTDGFIDLYKFQRHQFHFNDDMWKFPNFVTRNRLRDEKYKLMSNGTFTLDCMFSASIYMNFEEKLTYYIDTNPTVNPSYVESYESLSNDFRDIFKNKKHADVMLRVSNETIQAHKSVLTARSSVFSAMFKQNMTESNTSEITITDLDVETINLFLEFLYTGVVDLMCYEIALKLLLAADKYQVQSLVEKCSDFLISVLTTENVCNVLVIADKVRQEQLKIAAFDYIKNNASDILSTPGWSLWITKNFILGSEILCKLSIDLRNHIKKPK